MTNSGHAGSLQSAVIIHEIHVLTTYIYISVIVINNIITACIILKIGTTRKPRSGCMRMYKFTGTPLQRLEHQHYLDVLVQLQQSELDNIQ